MSRVTKKTKNLIHNGEKTYHSQRYLCIWKKKLNWNNHVNHHRRRHRASVSRDERQIR